MRADFPRFRRLALSAGLLLLAGAAQAQEPRLSYAPSGVSYAPPPVDDQAMPEETAPTGAPRRARATRIDIQPYLEVAQVVSADLDGGDTLTYTSVAAGIDGRVESRRVSVQIGYRYQRNIEWEGAVGDRDQHAGLAAVNVRVVPGLLDFEAGALATRTGGEGRAFGPTARDGSVEVYSAYAGPTLSAQAGPIAINGAYRVGYVEVDDDLVGAGPGNPFDDAVAHSATLSAGMAPGRLPIGWTVGAGYARTDSDGDFEERFEGSYVRGDVVLLVSPTFALTAGIGYEDIKASQNDILLDANGFPIIGPDGDVAADPNRRILAYDIDGIIYDAGLIWRPSSRTELQARAGHRYGGTTVVGTFRHQFSAQAGLQASLFDTVETFAGLLSNEISSLPDDFEIGYDPITGGLNGCVFGSDPGSGACLARALQSIRGGTFRMRGASLIVSGNRRQWDWGLGAGYLHRDFGRDGDPLVDLFGASEDESFTLFGSLGRQLSRHSDLGLDLHASWFASNEEGADTIFSTGATATYSRRLFLDRMRLIAALGLDHADDGTFDSTTASGLLGLRYSF